MTRSRLVPTHRPLLDGVRGVAVALVFGYHLGGRARLPGSWAAMDVFFVLSGYLITMLLVREYESAQRIDVVAFYRRRVRRLAPALLLVLAAVAIVSWRLGPSTTPGLRADGLATLGFVANWRFVWSAQSYFASFEPSLLRHAWSLAVEEQFYLLWPLLFGGLARVTGFRRRPLVIVLVAGAVASAGWMAYLAGGTGDLSRAYYGTDTRAQALFVGAILAVLLGPAAEAGPRLGRIAPTVGTVALGGLAIVMVGFGDGGRAVYTRGGFLLIAVLAAALLFGCLHTHRGPLRWIFGNRALRHLGLVSYGFYLWHWPVIRILDPVRTGLDPLPLGLLRLAVSLLLAEVTYRGVGRPIRTGTWPIRRRTSVLAAAMVTVLVLLIAVGFRTDRPATGDRSGSSTGRTVLVLGDSVAWVLAGTAPDDLGWRVQGMAIAHCDVVGDRIGVGDEVDDADPDCARWPARWAEAIDEHEPDAILVALGLRQLFDPVIDGERIPVGSDRWRQHHGRAIEAARTVIRDRSDVPVLWFDVACHRWDEVGGRGEEHDRQRLDAVDRSLRAALAADDTVTVFPYRDRMCGGPGRDVVENRLRPDGAHPDAAAAEALWREVRAELDRLVG